MSIGRMAIACGIVLLVLAIVVAVLLAGTPPRTSPAPHKGPEEQDEPPAEQYASSMVEDQVFSVPDSPVHANDELSTLGEELAAELGNAVPVVNATFTDMSFQVFMDLMMREGVVFVAHDRPTDGFYRVTSKSPVSFEATAPEALLGVNPRYCRIGATGSGTRDVVQSWRRSHGTPASAAPDILMFLPKRVEWAVLGALASATPPPAQVTTYRGTYRRCRSDGIELVIQEAVRRDGVAVAMTTTVVF